MRYSYSNLTQKFLVNPILNTLIANTTDQTKNSGKQGLTGNLNVKKLILEKKIALATEYTSSYSVSPLKNKKLEISHDNSPQKLFNKSCSPTKRSNINSQHTENDDIIHSGTLYPDIRSHLKKSSMQISGIFGNKNYKESVPKPPKHRTLSTNNHYLFPNNSPGNKYNIGHGEANLLNSHSSSVIKHSVSSANTISPIILSSNKMLNLSNLSNQSPSKKLFTSEMILNK